MYRGYWLIGHHWLLMIIGYLLIGQQNSVYDSDYGLVVIMVYKFIVLLCIEQTSDIEFVLCLFVISRCDFCIEYNVYLNRTPNSVLNIVYIFGVV